MNELCESVSSTKYTLKSVISDRGAAHAVGGLNTHRTKQKSSIAAERDKVQNMMFLLPSGGAMPTATGLAYVRGHHVQD